jgi:mono/diheme cytochrome c family protein
LPFTPERILAGLRGGQDVAPAPMPLAPPQPPAPNDRWKNPFVGRRGALATAAALCVAVVGVAAAVLPWRSIAPIARPDPSTWSAATIARGQQLAALGDCAVCHTVTNGVVNAGGRPIETPFGTIYATNITPDVETGIGAWSYPAFERAMREGIHRDGRHLYPAFPYTHFAKTSDADLQALHAYLMAQPAMRAETPENKLAFPFNLRPLMAGWNALFHQAKAFEADATKSATWNRGAYLVEGLGHCGMCHSPINALGGTSQSDAFKGGLIPMQNWYAPSLTSNKEAGLGDWTIEEITDYLTKGVSSRGAVYGPMAEVVYNSLQYLNDDDARAMAIYLKSLAQGASPEKPATPLPSAESSLLLSLGKPIYDRECASCHGAVGLGMPPHSPPLAGNQSIQMVSAVNAIRMVLNGGYPPGTAGNPMPYGMPPFAHRMSDDEVAAVVTYIRTSWGNRGAAVSARQANELRAATLN